MDKYEYRAKTEEMLALVRDGEFEKAESIADSIDWRRVRSVSMLSTVSAIYEKRKHYYDAREILYIAYDRAKNSKKTLFKLTELAIKSGDLEDATDCYHEYASIADRDPNKFVLEYKLAEAKSEPLSRQIDILEKLKDQEYTEKWAYKLATLYSDAGMDEKCIEECDEISLWFTDGKYVKKALELKSRYTGLTSEQERVVNSNSREEEEIPEIQRAAGMLLESEVRTRAIEDSREANGLFGRGKGLLGEVMSSSKFEDKHEAEAKDDELEDEDDGRRIIKPDDDRYSDTMNIGTDYEVAGLENAVIPGVSIAENLDMEIEGLKQDDEMKELDILQGDFDMSSHDSDVEMITDEPTEEFNVFAADTADLSAPTEISDDTEHDDPYIESDEPDHIKAADNGSDDHISLAGGEGIEEQPESAETVSDDEPDYSDEEESDDEPDYSDDDESGDEPDYSDDDESGDEADYSDDDESGDEPDYSDDDESDDEPDYSDDDESDYLYDDELEKDTKPKKHRFGLGAFFMRKKDPFYGEDEDYEEDDEQGDISTDEYIAENVEYQDRQISEDEVYEIPETETEVLQVESPEYDQEAYEEIKEVVKNLQGSESSEDDPLLSNASMEKLERKLEKESVSSDSRDISEMGSLDLHGEILAGLAKLDGAVELNEEEPAEQTKAEMTEIKPDVKEDSDIDLEESLAVKAQEVAANKLEELIDDEDDINKDDFLGINESLEDLNPLDTDDDAYVTELMAAVARAKADHNAGINEDSEKKEFINNDKDPGIKVPVVSDANEFMSSDEKSELKALMGDDEYADSKEPANRDLNSDAKRLMSEDQNTGARELSDEVETLDESDRSDEKEQELLHSNKKAVKFDSENSEDYEDDETVNDGRFIMTERYNLESQAHIGKAAGLTDVERQIFSYFVPVKGISEQLAITIASIRNSNKRGTSAIGNVIVAGDSGSGKTKLAVGIVKAIQKEYKKKKGRVAVVNAESLNGKNIKDVFDKLYGGAIVIENAGKLEKRTVKSIAKVMRSDTGELLVIIEDSPSNINKLLSVDKAFAESFDSRVVIPKFVNDDLVTFAQTYARENGYRIQEMAILALYNRIDMLQREDHYVTVAEVARLMDEAFAKSKKNSLKRTMTSLFKSNDEDKGLTLLMEEDFE